MPRPLVWPDPRVKPPFGAVTINWGHPLANGLVRCWLVNEGGGDTIYDLASSDHMVFATGSARPAWAAGKLGVEALFDGSSDHALDNQAVGSGLPDFLNGVAEYSVVSWLRSDVGHPPADDDYAVTSYNAGGDKHFILGKSNGADKFFFTAINSSGTESTAVANAADTGLNYHLVAGTWRAGTVYIYVDGIEQSSTAALTGSSANRIQPLRFGTQDSVSKFWQGAIGTTYITLRSYSAGEMLWLYAEPYAMLTPIVRRRVFAPSTRIVRHRVVMA